MKIPKQWKDLVATGWQPPTRILSIRQPWAWLIVNGHKDVENRTWATKYRGRVLIHAGKGMTNSEWSEAITFAMTQNLENVDYLPSLNDVQLGEIVGEAEIVDCVTDSKSGWAQAGFQHWVLKSARPLPFVAMKGMLGLWSVKYEQ